MATTDIQRVNTETNLRNLDVVRNGQSRRLSLGKVNMVNLDDVKNSPRGSNGHISLGDVSILNLETSRKDSRRVSIGLDSIVEQLEKGLTIRDIFSSSSATSKPKLIPTNQNNRQTDRIDVAPINAWEESEFNYEEGEEIKLEDLKHHGSSKKWLVKTEDFYTSACSTIGVSPVSMFLKQCKDYQIQLKNSSLSAKDIKAICIALARDHKIKSFDVSGNEIGAKGIKYIGEMMADNITITELNLSGTIPGKDGMKTLAELLKKNASLKKLWLEDNKIEHTEINHITEIIENVPTLQELYLGHNCLGFEGGDLLAEVIKTNRTIKVLDLQWNQIRGKTAKSICKALGENKTLLELNLSWNGLSKEGCMELAHSLKNNESLTDLDISSNRIDMTSLKFLLDGLSKNEGLKYLQLGRNPITTEGAKAVVKIIHMSPKSKIESVDLEDIAVDDEFLEIMEDLQKEKSIDFNHGEVIRSSNAMDNSDKKGNGLNRFDPFMVLVEYIRIDNLRVIDFFQNLDTNSSGKLTKSNFRDGFANIGIPFTEDHLDTIFKRADANRDGYIHLEEFIAAHKEMTRQIVHRTTKAKAKGKVDEGLVSLRKLIKGIIEKRSDENKEKARQKLTFAAMIKALNATRRFSTKASKDNKQSDKTADKASLAAAVNAITAARRFSVAGNVSSGTEDKTSFAAAVKALTASRKFSLDGNVSSNNGSDSSGGAFAAAVRRLSLAGNLGNKSEGASLAAAVTAARKLSLVKNGSESSERKPSFAAAAKAVGAFKRLSVPESKEETEEKKSSNSAAAKAVNALKKLSLKKQDSTEGQSSVLGSMKPRRFSIASGSPSTSPERKKTGRRASLTLVKETV